MGSSFGDPPDGGPDQQCAEIVCNAGSFRHSQSGNLVPGDLIRWLVVKDLLKTDFEVYPVEGGSLPVYDKPPIKGVNGRTKFMQVRLPDAPSDGVFKFVVKIGRSLVGEGQVKVDRTRRRKPPLKKAAKKAAKKTQAK